MFGGNVVFANHSDATRRTFAQLSEDGRGFNVCTDLLIPKREGTVTRVHRFEDTSKYWLTRYMKCCMADRPNEKAKGVVHFEGGRSGK